MPVLTIANNAPQRHFAGYDIAAQSCRRLPLLLNGVNHIARLDASRERFSLTLRMSRPPVTAL